MFSVKNDVVQAALLHKIWTRAIFALKVRFVLSLFKINVFWFYILPSNSMPIKHSVTFNIKRDIVFRPL